MNAGMASFPYSGLPMDIAKMMVSYLIHNDNVQSIETYNYNNLFGGPANHENSETLPESIFELNNKHWVITGQTSALLLACKSVSNEVIDYRLQHTDTLDFLTCCQVPSGKVAGRWNTFNGEPTEYEPSRALHLVSRFIADNYSSTKSDHQNQEMMACAARILKCLKRSMFKSNPQTQVPVIWAAQMFKQFLQYPKPVGWFKQLKQVNLRYPGHMVGIMSTYELQRSFLGTLDQIFTQKLERRRRRVQRDCGVEHLRDAMNRHSFADELFDICNLFEHPILVRECPHLRINLEIDMRRPFGGHWGRQLAAFVGSIKDLVETVLRYCKTIYLWPNPISKLTLLARLTITFTGTVGSVTICPFDPSGLSGWPAGRTVGNITS